MLAIERRRAIAKLVSENGSATISELAARFGVSSETLRKDLLALEKERLLTRTHGGAVRTAKRQPLAPLQARRLDHVDQKRELCEYAIRYIRNGDIIAIDASSTGAVLARLIAQTFTKLTVVTNGLDVMNALVENPGLRVVLCGGDYMRSEMTFTGPLTESLVNELHFDKCFIFPSGVSLKHGVTDTYMEFLSVQRAWIARSDEVFVLAYSDRFETAAYVKLDEVRREYTTSRIPAFPKRFTRAIWKTISKL